MAKKLTEKQMIIARMAKPFNKITGADFKMFEYGPDYIVYSNQLKEKYPYLTTYNIINFYKIHLMYELGKTYDEILFLDFDVVPIQNLNFFEHWDLTKGIAVLNNNDRRIPIERVNDTSQTIRSPSSKYFNSQAMLFEKGLNYRTSSIMKIPTSWHTDKSSKHLYQILVDENKRDEIINHLYKNEIYPGVHYIDNTIYPMYKYAHGTCPNAHQYSKQLITLPIHLNLKDKDCERIVDKLGEIL